MGFVNGFISSSFTSKYPYKRTVFESRHYMSKGILFALGINFLILVKTPKWLLAVLRKLFVFCKR